VRHCDDPRTRGDQVRRMRYWYTSPLIVLLLVIAILSLACTTRPMVCTWVRIDDEQAPAMMCADASIVKGSRIRPWDGTPSPELPERQDYRMRQPGEHGDAATPYWHYEGFDYYWKEHTSVR